MVIANPQADPIPFNRLLAIDLRSLSEDQMAALSTEAMRRGCSLSDLLGQLVDEVSKRILDPQSLPIAASSPSQTEEES